MLKIIVVTEKDILLDEWGSVKKRTAKDAALPVFKQGEIWWCKTGENVGIEINGKGSNFGRPVLVLKKLSRHGFFGLPLTSQSHPQNSWWYAEFSFRGRVSYVALAQARTFSALRLDNRIGVLFPSEFERIREAFRKFYL